MVHDEGEICASGDVVRIEACRPMSKRKHFALAELLQRRNLGPLDAKANTQWKEKGYGWTEIPGIDTLNQIFHRLCHAFRPSCHIRLEQAQGFCSFTTHRNRSEGRPLHRDLLTKMMYRSYFTILEVIEVIMVTNVQNAILCVHEGATWYCSLGCRA